MAREAIAGVRDVDPHSFELVVAPVVPAAVRALVDEAASHAS
jgi:hypothetical protein